MREFTIYKKRDGQSFKEVSYIFAESFDAAKKEFALKMTNDNHELSNDICWLDKEDGVNETGWYDMNSGSPKFYEETEKYTNPKDLENMLFCSEAAINEGFDSWNEDVYTWEIRE